MCLLLTALRDLRYRWVLSETTEAAATLLATSTSEWCTMLRPRSLRRPWLLGRSSSPTLSNLTL